LGENGHFVMTRGAAKLIFFRVLNIRPASPKNQAGLKAN